MRAWLLSEQEHRKEECDRCDRSDSHAYSYPALQSSASTVPKIANANTSDKTSPERRSVKIIEFELSVIADNIVRVIRFLSR
jgi:hypothetical protein